METLDADEYRTITYYERWMAGIAKALLARGIITTDELGRHMAAAGDEK